VHACVRGVCCAAKKSVASVVVCMCGHACLTCCVCERERECVCLCVCVFACVCLCVSVCVVFVSMWVYHVFYVQCTP